MTLGAVGIRSSGYPTWELMDSIVCLKSPRGFKYLRVGSERTAFNIDDAANELVIDYLKDDKLEWILFVDDDAVIHSQTLNRLLSRDVNIVSALSFTRRIPIAPVFFGHKLPEGGYPIEFMQVADWLTQYPEMLAQGPILLPEAPPNSLREVGFTGLHCTLIRREVFENLKYPWFVKVDGHKGEDTYFCERALEYGYKVYVDMSVTTGHIGQHQFSALDFQAWMLWMQQREEFLRKDDL